MVSRRQFLKVGLLGGVVGATAAMTSSGFNTENLETSEINLSSPKLPKAFEGYKIAFISDIHCGVFLSDNLLEKTISTINKAEADLLILGGDYIGVPDSEIAHFFSYIKSKAYRVRRTKELVSSIFRRLGKALQEIKTKDGMLAVMGNHDHWNNGAICRSILPEYGVKILLNEEVAISKSGSKIIIYGTDDYWTGIPRVSQSFLTNMQDLRILVSHNPDFISDSMKAHGTYFDLALAGHTHGGQIYLPGLGPLGGYGVRDRRFFTGTKKIENSLVHTSRGIGVVDIPYRVNSTPEISIFTLNLS